MKRKGLAGLRTTSVAFVLAASLCLTACGSSDDSADKNEKKTEESSEKKDLTGWELADAIVEDVKKNEPVFDDYSVSITDFGAEVKTDKITDKAQEAELAKSNTEAINKAMEDVSSHKGDDGKLGGTVNVPAGYTYTAAIHMLDNVNLHFEDGAYLMFTTDYEQYPNVLTRWEGIECYNYSPMIYAYQKKNIAITGKGILDGQATKEEYWLPWKNKKYLPEQTQDDDRKALFQMSADKTPIEERVFGTGHYLRPCFMQTFECENVLIEDVTINNSPFWMVHPVFTNYLTVRGITVESDGYNNDGVNPDSCKNVVIEKCTFKTGDDCIAIKSGRNNDGMDKGIACENVVAQNNDYVTGKGACATIGSEMSGNVKNIFFRDNKSESTVEHLQAISIKTNGDRGGTIDGIYIKGIQAANTEDRAVLITMFYEEGDTEVTTPVIKNVYVEDSTFKCEKPDKEQDVIAIWGYERSLIENIQFKNCTFEGTDAALNIHNVKGLNFENCTVNGEKLPEGEFVPEDNVSIVKSSINTSCINLAYSCGLPESELNQRFLVADTEDGEYTEVEDTGSNFFCKMSSNGSEVTLLNIDPAKYYKFAMTINGKEWESEVFHVAATN